MLTVFHLYSNISPLVLNKTLKPEAKPKQSFVPSSSPHKHVVFGQFLCGVNSTLAHPPEVKPQRRPGLPTIIPLSSLTPEASLFVLIKNCSGEGIYTKAERAR